MKKDGGPSRQKFVVMTAAKCGDDSVDDDDEDDEDDEGDEGDEGDEEINVGGVGFGTGVDDGIKNIRTWRSRTRRWADWCGSAGWRPSFSSVLCVWPLLIGKVPGTTRWTFY